MFLSILLKHIFSHRAAVERYKKIFMKFAILQQRSSHFSHYPPKRPPSTPTYCLYCQLFSGLLGCGGGSEEKVIRGILPTDDSLLSSCHSCHGCNLSCSFWCNLVDAVSSSLWLLFADLTRDGLLDGPLVVSSLLVEHLLPVGVDPVPANAGDPVVDVGAVGSLLWLGECFFLRRSVFVVNDDPVRNQSLCLTHSLTNVNNGGSSFGVEFDHRNHIFFVG